MKIKGVKKAEWNIDTKLLTLIYATKIISLEKIHEKLALAGHDTVILCAPKTKYNKLPECCKYIREKLLLNDKQDAPFCVRLTTYHI